jgi:hypothetical protein
MHQSAVADWCEQSRKGQVKAQHIRAQVALGHCDRMPWTKHYRIKCAAVCSQRDFAFRASVQVIEHDTRQPPLGEAAQILDINDARRRDGARWMVHVGSMPYTAILISESRPHEFYVDGNGSLITYHTERSKLRQNSKGSAGGS